MHELPARRAEAVQRGDDPIRDEIMEAMLVACGELGYRKVAVKDVLARYGGHRVQFWQNFASKEECFAMAYLSWANRLVAELLEAASAAGSWRGGLRAALVTFFRFIDEHPQVARALLLDAEIGGGPALDKREEAIQILGGAIDTAREQAGPDDRPPPLTGDFIAGGIATYTSEQLAAGAKGAPWQGLPELMRFATAPYFGEQAAEAEFEAADSALARLSSGEDAA
jgi:AcrR family transcriptional regulator